MTRMTNETMVRCDEAGHQICHFLDRVGKRYAKTDINGEVGLTLRWATGPGSLFDDEEPTCGLQT